MSSSYPRKLELRVTPEGAREQEPGIRLESQAPAKWHDMLSISLPAFSKGWNEAVPPKASFVEGKSTVGQPVVRRADDGSKGGSVKVFRYPGGSQICRSFHLANLPVSSTLLCS